jgi:hypothetical protein
MRAWKALDEFLLASAELELVQVERGPRRQREEQEQ